MTTLEPNWPNLLKLADALEQPLPMKFDMLFFRGGDNPEVTPGHLCGTVACAAGMGPALPGLAPSPECFGGVYLDWNRYLCETFGVRDTDRDSLGVWCFSGAWTTADNTPEGAAARIRWAHQHGVPDNYFEQLYGQTPLCYR